MMNMFKIKKWFFVGIMSLLGLSACKEEPEIVPMYGVVPREYDEKDTPNAYMPTSDNSENNLSHENKIPEI